MSVVVYVSQLPVKAVKNIQLHGFGDASKAGCCLTVYVVASDGVKTTQGFLTSKVRVAKKNLAIPRLELVSGHMVANMLDNTRNVLKRYTVTSCHGWLDSTLALYWIQDDRQYKQFVANRVRKMREKKDHQLEVCTNRSESVGSGKQRCGCR